jgi:hypothetical protein
MESYDVLLLSTLISNNLKIADRMVEMVFVRSKNENTEMTKAVFKVIESLIVNEKNNVKSLYLNLSATVTLLSFAENDKFYKFVAQLKDLRKRMLLETSNVVFFTKFEDRLKECFEKICATAEAEKKCLFLAARADIFS